MPGDVAANLDQPLRLARLATAGGANVVVFPELSLTGSALGQADALAFQRMDERLEPLLSLAHKATATIIPGAPVRLGGTRHIGAAVMDADGGLEWYTKRHLGRSCQGGDPRLKPPEPGGRMRHAASAATPGRAASSLAGSSIWDARGELVLQLEPTGPGVGIARETADGRWQPATRIMTLGSMGLEGIGVG